MRESQLLFPNIIKSIVIDRIIFMYRKLRCGCFLINTMCFLLDFSCCHAHIALSSVVSSKIFIHVTENVDHSDKNELNWHIFISFSMLADIISL